MLLSSKNVDVHVERRLDTPCITFIFKGKFTQEASELSTQAWQEHFTNHPNQKFAMIWDCQQMTGFEMSARREWLKHMHILYKQIDRVIVISDSVLIRGAARLMLKLFSFKSELYESDVKVWEVYPEYV